MIDFHKLSKIKTNLFFLFQTGDKQILQSPKDKLQYKQCKYILRLQQIIRRLKFKQYMGNTFEQKSSLLVKNWVKLNNNTYRNAITQELIDQYVIEYKTEEEMVANHKQLMARANINHPNVIKLIYFSQNQKGCCSDKVYAHKVFVEHQNQKLSQYLSNFDQKGKSECFCCPLINAFNVLAQKYGYFRVKEEMVFLASQTKWHKSQDKKTVKVWINSSLHINRAEYQSKQEQMCQSLYKIFEIIDQKAICDKIKIVARSIFKMNNLVEHVYKIHNSILVKQIDKRKRVSSSFSIPNMNIPTLLKVNQSSQDTLIFKNNRPVSNFIIHGQTDRNFNRTAQIQIKNDNMQTMKKITPTTTTKKVVIMQNQNKEVAFPFYKPSNKVSFAYNDLFSTPKQNKIIQQLNASSPNIVSHQKQAKVESKPQQANQNRKLQRLTVNIMVQNQQQRQKCSLNEISQPSEQFLKKKLQQIVQSSNHIASSPFLIDVNQPYQYQSRQMSETPPIRNLDTEPIVISHQNIFEEDYPTKKQTKPFQVQTQPQNRFFADPSKIPLSQSLQDSADGYQNDLAHKQKQKTDRYLTAMELQMAYQGDQSGEVQPIPKFGSIGIKPPVLHHTQSNFSIENNKSNGRHREEEVASYYEVSATNSEYSKLDNNYNKYLQKFNQVINPTMSPRSKFSSSSKTPPFQSLPSHSSQGNRQIAQISHPKTYNKYNSLTMEDSLNRRKSKSKPSQIKVNNTKDGEIQSLYNESEASQRQNKAKIIQRIENTQKIIRQNRKKLEKLQLEKDLQRQKEIIKKQMDTLLKNNLMVDQSNRIKEKVKNKKATFAQLKAEASKILEDFSF